MRIFLFNRTILQVFVTYRTGAICICTLCDTTDINTIIEFVPNCFQHVIGDGFIGGCSRKGQILYINIYNIIYLFTAIGLSPGDSGYFTCKQNMKLVTTKFKSGGLHEKHVVAT